MNRRSYYYLVAIGVLSISLSPIITRASHSPSLVIAANRMLYTVLLLTPFTLGAILREVRTIPVKSLLLNLTSGVFLGLHFWSWIDSLQHTSVANSTILVNLHPIFILVIGRIFLKEKVDRTSILSTLIAISGSLLLIYHSLTHLSLNVRGDLMAVVGALTVSVYLTIGAQIRQHVSNKTYTYIAYLTAFVTLLALSWPTQTQVFSYPPSDILVFLGLAVVPTLLGHSLFNMSMKTLNPHFISMAILGEPIMASLWAYLLFSEKISPIQWAGGMMIIAGLAIKIRYGQSTR